MTENVFAPNTAAQAEPQAEPTLRRNLTLPQGVLQKNLKTLIYLGAALLVIVAALFSSSGKKTPPQQAATKGQPPQPSLQDNTDNNVQELKNQLQAERQKEQQATAAAAAMGDPGLASATPAQQTTAAAYGPTGVAVPCVPGQPCPQMQQGNMQMQPTPVQQEAQLIAAKERERADNSRFASNLVYARAADQPQLQQPRQGQMMPAPYDHSDRQATPYVDPVLTSTLFSIRLPLHPNLLLNMQSDFAPELVHGLLTSKLDLALIANPGANRKLTMTKITEAPFYVAFPDDHPLAARESLTLEDMRGCTWIIFDRKVHPILHDMISRRAAEDGVIYKNNQNVLTAEEAFQLVSENVGIAFLTMASALRTKSPSVTVRPLVDKELRIELYLASRADNRSKLASEFVRAFMKRIEQVLAPPQMILPLSDSPLIPNETMAAKHRPKSERGIKTKPDAQQARPRKPKSR